MSGVRIKDIQSAKSVIEQGFDQFDFVVDSPDLDVKSQVTIEYNEYGKPRG